LDSQSKDRAFLFLSLVVSFLILLPLLWYGFGADQGIFSYSVWIWRKFGQAPYTYVFDQAFPGIFLIHYFVQAVIGESVTSFRVFDLAWQSATAAVIYLVTFSIFKNRLAGLLASIMYSFFCLELGPWNSGQRDGFLTLLYLLSFWLLTRQEAARKILWQPILAGFLIGFAFLIKPTAALLALVFMVMIFKNARPRLPAISAFCFSCALPSLAVIIYYWRLDGLKDLYQVLFEFNAEIYAGSMIMPLSLAVKGIILMRLWSGNLGILIGALLLALFWKKVRVGNGSGCFWLLLIFLAAYAGYIAQGKYFIYQQAPVWGLLCLFSGAGWAETFELLAAKTGASKRAGAFAASVLIILLAVSLFNLELLKFLSQALPLKPSQGQKVFTYYKFCALAADYVRVRAAPQDKVQVWGNEALINFLAKRRAPTRFPQTFPLLLKPKQHGKNAFQKGLAEQFLESLKKDPPVYFLVANEPYLGFGINSTKRVLIDDYPQVWDFINEKYWPEYQMRYPDGGIEFYRIKVSAQESPQAQEQQKQNRQ